MTFKNAQDLLGSMLPRSSIYKRNINADKKLTEPEKNTLLMIVIDFERMSGKYNYKLALDNIKNILDSRFRVLPSSKRIKKNGEVIYLNPPAVPFLVKQVIFFIAVSCIVYEEIKYTQADICRNLNLSHNFFGKLSKKPKGYIEMQQYIQPERFMTYSGQKDVELGVAIKNLVYQADKHGYFVDIFGGTGAASTAIIHQNNVQYVYNDKDELMYNLFKVIADDNLYLILIKTIKLLKDDLRGYKKWLNVNFVKEIEVFCSNRSEGENEPRVRDKNPFDIEYSYEDIVNYMREIYECLNSQDKNTVYCLKDGTSITVDNLISKIFSDIPINWENIDMSNSKSTIKIKVDYYSYLSNSTQGIKGNITMEKVVMSFYHNYRAILDIESKFNSCIYMLGNIKDNNGNTIDRIDLYEKEGEFMQYRFYKYYAYFDNLIKSCKNSIAQKDRVLYAVAMIFCYNLTTKGSVGVSAVLRMLFERGGRQNKALEPKRFLGKDFKSIITVMHNSIKGMICENEDYLKIINRYKSHGIQNAVSPLFYSDSPYVDTKGYRVPFADTEIVKLINALVDSGDKFIFSCRAVKSSDDEKDEARTKIEAGNDKIFRYVFGSFLAAPEIYEEIIDGEDYEKFKVYKEKILNGEEPDIIEDKKKEYYKKLYVLSIGDEKELEDAIAHNKVAEIMITNFEIVSFKANIKKKGGKTVKEQEVKFEAYTFEKFLEILCKNANNQLTALLRKKFNL